MRRKWGWNVMVFGLGKTRNLVNPLLLQQLTVFGPPLNIIWRYITYFSEASCWEGWRVIGGANILQELVHRLESLVVFIQDLEVLHCC